MLTTKSEAMHRFPHNGRLVNIFNICRHSARRTPPRSRAPPSTVGGWHASCAQISSNWTGIKQHLLRASNTTPAPTTIYSPPFNKFFNFWTPFDLVHCLYTTRALLYLDNFMNFGISQILLFLSSPNFNCTQPLYEYRPLLKISVAILVQ